MNTGTANIREIERAVISYYSELAAGYSKPSAEEGSTIACVDAEVEFIELLNARILHGADLIEIYGKFYVSAFAQCEKNVMSRYKTSVFDSDPNLYPIIAEDYIKYGHTDLMIRIDPKDARQAMGELDNFREIIQGFEKNHENPDYNLPAYMPTGRLALPAGAGGRIVIMSDVNPVTCVIEYEKNKKHAAGAIGALDLPLVIYSTTASFRYKSGEGARTSDGRIEKDMICDIEDAVIFISGVNNNIRYLYSGGDSFILSHLETAQYLTSALALLSLAAGIFVPAAFAGFVIFGFAALFLYIFRNYGFYGFEKKIFKKNLQDIKITGSASMVVKFKGKLKSREDDMEILG